MNATEVNRKPAMPRSIDLLLSTPRGDEVGRLRLEQAAVAASGASGGGVRPNLSGQMDALCERIQAALNREGVVAALDDIDLRIVASLALLGPETETVAIPLTVREIASDEAATPDLASKVDAPHASESEADDGDAEWDDLFDLDTLDPEGPEEDELGDNGERGGFHG